MREKRVPDKEMEEFMDEFMEEMNLAFPKLMIQFEVCFCSLRDALLANRVNCV